MLSAIAAKFMEKKLVASTWEAEMQARGDLVSLFRQYYDGDHRLKLTPEMKAMMQIADDKLDRYNDNYCEMVVNAMADRLTVDRMQVKGMTESTDKDAVDPAQAWTDDLLNANRFDALQLDVREAALRDGETFVMLEYNDTLGQMQLFHNLAWDGECGVMVVYDRQQKNILAGAKVWYDGDLTRVNLYYPNSTERYTAEEGATELTLMAEADGFRNPEDTTRNGKVPGVPIVRFSRKKKATSELKNVIPLQDSLNRTLVSMVMSAELTAFSVMFAVGWKPPQKITPGMIYHAMLTDVNGNTIVPQDEDQAKALVAMLNAFKLSRIEGGDLSQLIKQGDWIINQIEKITSTPVDLGGGGQSGEALKQLDVRLQGKIEGAQVTFGNSYEDMVKLAAWQQSIFGSKMPPEIKSVNAQWKNAEMRNNADVLALFKLLNDAGYEEEALRTLGKSSLVNYGPDDIKRIMGEKAVGVAQKMVEAAGNLPDFSSAFVPTSQPLLN